MTASRFALRFDRWFTMLATPLGMGPKHSAVVLDDAEVGVTLGIGFHCRFPRSAIAAAEVASGPVSGFGAHGWRGRWLVNGSSSALVRLQLDGPHRGSVLGVPVKVTEITVSLVDPEGFLAALGLPPQPAA